MQAAVKDYQAALLLQPHNVEAQQKLVALAPASDQTQQSEGS